MVEIIGVHGPVLQVVFVLQPSMLTFTWFQVIPKTDL
jgi:hypothetical protein